MDMNTGITVTDLIDNTQDIIIVLTLNLTIQIFNRAAEHYYGWRKAEVLGKNFRLLCEQKAYEVPLPKNLSKVLTGTPATKVETIIIKEDERVYTAIWSCIAKNDESGDPFALMLIGQDITEYRQQLQHSRALESRFNQIFAATPGGIYWKDRDGVYQGCNDVLTEMAGFPSKKANLGRTDYDILPKKKADDYSEHYI
jgi:PAS domain S-box-containing protein